MCIFQVAKRKKSNQNDSLWSNFKLKIKETFEYEDKLEIFYYNPTALEKSKKWTFSELGFSFYQEAYEYVKDLQREDNEFDANISKLKDQSRTQFNEFISTSRSTKSHLANQSDIQDLKNKVDELLRLFKSK